MPSVTKKELNDYDSWNEKFENGKVELSEIKYHSSWEPMFELLFESPKLKKTELGLSDAMIEEKKIAMYPPPDLVFHAFRLTKFDNVKVVILGQDPYFDKDQATGLSFSIPSDMPIPSSLKNIFKNLITNGHLDEYPANGDLTDWAKQGCLMLNTSLTVLHGSGNKNCHQKLWAWFTDNIIQYISDNKDNVVFVLWGSNAYEKINLIDLDKHEVIISSHPSGLSADKPMKSNPSFNACDHFGQINKLLKKWKIDEIEW